MKPSLEVLFECLKNDLSVTQSDLVNNILETLVLISPGDLSFYAMCVKVKKLKTF